MIYHKKAFTLLELMVVIAIIGILLGILFLQVGITLMISNTEKKTELEIVGLRNAIDEYLTDFGEYPNCPKEICTPGETLFMSLAGFHNENGGLELPLIHPRFHPIFFIMICLHLMRLKYRRSLTMAENLYNYGLQKP